jgi:hypothetical protein
MNTRVTKTLTFLGMEIGSVSIETELGQTYLRGERAVGRPSNGVGQVPLNEMDVTLVLAEVVKATGSLISDKISFEGGHELIVDGNGDPYTACQNLKRVLKTEWNVFTAVRGAAALTSAYGPNGVGPAGLFDRKLADVIHKNWELQEVSTK